LLKYAMTVAKQAQLENQSASRKRGNNTLIYATNRCHAFFRNGLQKLNIETNKCQIHAK